MFCVCQCTESCSAAARRCSPAYNNCDMAAGGGCGSFRCLAWLQQTTKGRTLWDHQEVQQRPAG